MQYQQSKASKMNPTDNVRSLIQILRLKNEEFLKQPFAKVLAFDA